MSQDRNRLCLFEIATFALKRPLYLARVYFFGFLCQGPARYDSRDRASKRLWREEASGQSSTRAIQSRSLTSRRVRDALCACQGFSRSQASIRVRIWSLISLNLFSFCSSVPSNPAGSSKGQCNRVVAPGKIGHRSSAWAHSVIT